MHRAPLVVVVLFTVGLSACSSASSTSGAAPSKAVTTAAGAGTTAAGAGTTAGATGDASDATTTVPRAKTIAEAPAVIAADAGLTNQQAECVVRKLAETLGNDKALAVVNASRDLVDQAEADRKAAGAALVACIDRKDFVKVISDNAYAVLKDLGATREQADCMAAKILDTLTPDGLLNLASNGLNLDGMDPAAQAQLLKIVAECMPSLAGLLAPGSTTTSAKP